jgi:glycine cleavage system aminomethyltransferase T
MATPAGLDGVSTEHGYLVRIARDEMMLLGAGADLPVLLAEAERALRPADPDAVVVDQSDGWGVWTIKGPDALEVLRRLMAAPIPEVRPGFLQGAIAGVPGKALVGHAELYLLVPSPVEHHLRDRILEACRDLEPVIGAAHELALGPEFRASRRGEGGLQ